jgi:hypothetical protein
MTVIPFEAARHRLRPAPPRRWRPDETTELLRLYATLNARGEAADYEYGETERHEPQFYALGADPAQDCLACVSRLSQDGRPWYVIEDGSGGLLAEGSGLGTLVTEVSRCWRACVARLLLIAPLLGRLLAEDDFADLAEEGVALVAASPVDAGTVAGLLSWTVQALAFA